MATFPYQPAPSQLAGSVNPLMQTSSARNAPIPMATPSVNLSMPQLQVPLTTTPTTTGGANGGVRPQAGFQQTVANTPTTAAQSTPGIGSTSMPSNAIAGPTVSPNGAGPSIPIAQTPQMVPQLQQQQLMQSSAVNQMPTSINPTQIAPQLAQSNLPQLQQLAQQTQQPMQPPVPPPVPPPVQQFNPPTPMQAAQATQPATQSVEQQALGGGSNPQQVQNFMQALGAVGAGNNNAFQNAPANNPQAATNAPLYNGQQFSNASTNNNVSGYYNPQTQSMQAGSASPVGATTQPAAPGNFQQTVANTPTTVGGVSPGVQITPPSPVPTGGANGGYQPQGGFQQTVANTPTTAAQSNPNLGLVSDQRAKEKIQPMKRELTQFLNNLTANKYEYKNKEHGDGEFYSPMAQDFEQSKLGKTMVETRPDGLKQVNYARGYGIITAAQALMHQRLSSLEKKLKGK